MIGIAVVWLPRNGCLTVSASGTWRPAFQAHFIVLASTFYPRPNHVDIEGHAVVFKYYGRSGSLKLGGSCTE